MLSIVHYYFIFSTFYLRNCQKVSYFAKVFEKKCFEFSFIN